MYHLREGQKRSPEINYALLEILTSHSTATVEPPRADDRTVWLRIPFSTCKQGSQVPKKLYYFVLLLSAPCSAFAWNLDSKASNPGSTSEAEWPLGSKWPSISGWPFICFGCLFLALVHVLYRMKKINHDWGLRWILIATSFIWWTIKTDPSTTAPVLWTICCINVALTIELGQIEFQKLHLNMRYDLPPGRSASSDFVTKTRLLRPAYCGTPQHCNRRNSETRRCSNFVTLPDFGIVPLATLRPSIPTTVLMDARSSSGES